MSTRNYKSDPVKLLEQGKKIMSSSKDTRFLFKVFAVNMVLSGSSAALVASMAGVTTASVTGWVKTVDEKGFDSLTEKDRPGRPEKLTAEQREKIALDLANDPAEYGYKVWDGPSLSAHIKSQFDVDMGVRQCQRLFHELGYSLIRAQPYPSKGAEDTEQRNSFKRTR